MGKLTDFSNTLLFKLLTFLEVKEGFLIDAYNNGKTAVVRDVFGNRYKVEITYINRTVLHEVSNDNQTIETTRISHG